MHMIPIRTNKQTSWLETFLRSKGLYCVQIIKPLYDPLDSLSRYRTQLTSCMIMKMAKSLRRFFLAFCGMIVKIIR